MDKLQQYLECQDDQVLDVYDSLIDSILQNQNEQEKMILFLKDYMQLVEIKRKIRILQLINEIICCNDQSFKQLIYTHFLELLKEYYEHQSKTIQSNYLCQEDELEVIELYMFVNKIIGYFEIQQTENLRLSIKKPKQQSEPEFKSRQSITLDDFGKNLEEKECQTDDDQELLKWKNKWELQFNYNQRLQSINQQLRTQIAELQKKQSTQQKSSSQIITSQPSNYKETSFNKEQLILSFGQSQSQQLPNTDFNQEEEEEDVILIQEQTQVKTNSPSVSSILKKPENDKKQKKKVQFLQRRITVQCYNYDNLFNETDKLQFQNFKKCSFSKYGIVFDDRQIQILMQVSNQQEFETALTILNRTNEEIKLSFLYKQPVNVDLRINGLILNSKQVQKQIIYNDKDEIIQLQIHYEMCQQSYDKLIIIPNFLNKYLQHNKITQQQYETHLDQIRNQDSHTLLELKLKNFTIDESNIFKIFPNYFKDDQKYTFISSMNYKQIQFYCKMKQELNEVTLKLLIERANENFGNRLLQQFASLFIIQKK